MYLNIARRNPKNNPTQFDTLIAVDEYSFNPGNYQIGDTIFLDLEAHNQQELDRLDPPENIYGIRRYQKDLFPDGSSHALAIEFELLVTRRIHRLHRMGIADPRIAQLTESSTIIAQAISDDVERVLIKFLSILGETELAGINLDQ
jgi:hypothetical protein